MNAPETPLGVIFPRADHLHLFAFTLGARISREIERLFQAHDFALGVRAGRRGFAAADNAGREAESWDPECQARQDRDQAFGSVLLYSPGYCGWHISGQKKLFECLRPERIGIRLNARFLMKPLKSLSGRAGGRAGRHPSVFRKVSVLRSL